jgi:hypothetical protein
MENGLPPIPKHLKHLAINPDHALRLAGIMGSMPVILAGQD